MYRHNYFKNTPRIYRLSVLIHLLKLVITLSNLLNNHHIRNCFLSPIHKFLLNKVLIEIFQKGVNFRQCYLQYFASNCGISSIYNLINIIQSYLVWSTEYRQESSRSYKKSINNLTENTKRRSLDTKNIF